MRVGGMDLIVLAEDTDKPQALLYVVMNLHVPLNAENFFSSQRTISFSRRTLLHGVSGLTYMVIP
jgi:hypothetical protein